jgi:DNA-binding CsgD family transcriptional regulator
MTGPITSVRKTEHPDGWVLILQAEAAQRDYEAAKAERRRIARMAAQHGVSRRQLAAAMGLTVSTVQGLIGRTTTKEGR